MISSFQRNLIQVELRKRLDQWRDPSYQSQAYAGLTVNPNVTKFVTERDQDGYYYISGELIAYCNLRNGLIFRIRKNHFNKDWTCYTELAAKGTETGSFRIDTPLFSQAIETNDGTWEYAELQSPGNDYGQNFNDDVFSWPELTNGLTPNAGITEELKTQVADYFRAFVDQSFVITREAKLIAEKNGCGLPLYLCYIFNRYKDNTGYFWSDFDQYSWTNTKEVVVADALARLAEALVFGKTCGVLDDVKLGEVYQYAREKWAAI